MKAIAYLACELKGRDLDSRLLVAARLLDRGITCIVGQQWALWESVATLPPGVLVATSASAVQAHNAQAFKDRGHKVVMSDEEALALVSPEHIRANVVPEAMAACDVFLAQSEAHARVLTCDKSNPLGYPDVRFEVTGNPRCDLLTDGGRQAFRTEASELCGGKPFILFNSNFALAHYLWGNIDDVTPEMAKEKGLRLDMLAWERENRRQFVTLIDWCIDNLPDHQIVLRPHPAEARGAWGDIAGRSSRLHVLYATMPVPWLLAADVVVHANCTTGLEAAMLGKRCINLSPDPGAEWHKAFITKDVNLTCFTAVDAGTLLGGPLNIAILDAAVDARLQEHLPDWDYGLAADKVAEQIAGLIERADYLTPDEIDAIRLTSEPIATSQRRAKFSVTQAETETRLLRIAHALGIGDGLTVKTRQLCDSALLMVPT